jgi:hypothetical protein
VEILIHFCRGMQIGLFISLFIVVIGGGLEQGHKATQALAWALCYFSIFMLIMNLTVWRDK